MPFPTASKLANVDIRSVRLALELRQIDIQHATGVSAQRLSQAERGLVQLSDLEKQAIEMFLRARLTSELRRGESA